MSTRLAVVHSDDLGMAYADHPADRRDPGRCEPEDREPGWRHVGQYHLPQRHRDLHRLRDLAGRGGVRRHPPGRRSYR